MRWAAFAAPLAVFLLLTGCGSSGKVEVAPRKPDLVLTIGYLDLSSHRGRIERKDLVSLSGVLKKEKVDVLGVTGIIRYPGVVTRTDFVDVLSSIADLRNAFGVASEDVGRQRGNAIFSVYPFHSTVTIPYDDRQSDEQSSAVLAVVDGGVSDIQVISTLLPQKSGDQHLRKAMEKCEENQPLVLLGNLPVNPSQGFTSASAEKEKSSGGPVWLRSGGLAEVLSVRSVGSVYGKVTIAQVGLFRRM